MISVWIVMGALLKAGCSTPASHSTGQASLQPKEGHYWLGRPSCYERTTEGPPQGREAFPRFPFRNIKRVQVSAARTLSRWDGFSADLVETPSSRWA